MKLSSNHRIPAVALLVAASLIGLAACSKDSTDSAGSTSTSASGAGPSSSAAPGSIGQPDSTAASTPTASSVPPATEQSTTTSSSTTTTAAPTTTTTTIPLVTEGGVLKVANASGVDGAAKQTTERLAALGFKTTPATNAAGIEPKLDTSKIYVMPGSEPVAFSIAQVMGDLPVSYMPTPVSIKGGPEALGGATIVVMLGADRAGKPTLAG